MEGKTFFEKPVGSSIIGGSVGFIIGYLFKAKAVSSTQSDYLNNISIIAVDSEVKYKKELFLPTHLSSDLISTGFSPFYLTHLLLVGPVLHMIEKLELERLAQKKDVLIRNDDDAFYRSASSKRLVALLLGHGYNGSIDTSAGSIKYITQNGVLFSQNLSSISVAEIESVRFRSGKRSVHSNLDHCKDNFFWYGFTRGLFASAYFVDKFKDAGYASFNDMKLFDAKFDLHMALDQKERDLLLNLQSVGFTINISPETGAYWFKINASEPVLVSMIKDYYDSILTP